MKNRSKHILFVVSGASGSGKTTLCEKMVKALPNMVHSISYTTRKKRPGEKHGRDYFFVTKQKFLELRKKRQFLEWAEIYGDYYATSKTFIKDQFTKGNDAILDIETVGAAKIKKKMKNACFVFVMPPSLTELKKRLINRKQDAKEIIQKRLSCAKEEMKERKWYDYVIVNDSLKNAEKKLKKIIIKKIRPDQQD